MDGPPVIADDIAAALPEMRAHAESRMTSTATVRRRTTTPNPSGPESEVWAVVHSGPMRLAGASRGASSSRTLSTPGGDVTLALRVTHWPASTPAFRDGDVVEVTAGESAGTFWVVVEADRADQQTAYRVPVVATAPIS